ncbi:MAG: response regulator [candidate division NC10 bacterium]|nr:response regulator [candidate division NC10 bacterium]
MAARILVADDSVTIQKVVELTFSKEDFVLVQARSGEEAIRKAKEVQPDLVLLDLVMPDKNGYEVCAALRAEFALRTVPIILLTGTFEAFDKEQGIRAGANDFVTKPFESQALISKVKQLLFSRTADLAASPAPAKEAPRPAAGVVPPPPPRVVPPSPGGVGVGLPPGAPLAAPIAPPTAQAAPLGPPRRGEPSPAGAASAFDLPPPTEEVSTDRLWHALDSPPAPTPAREDDLSELNLEDLAPLPGHPAHAAQEPGRALSDEADVASPPESLSLEELLAPVPTAFLGPQREPRPMKAPPSEPVFDLTAELEAAPLPLIEVGTGEPPSLSVEDLLRPGEAIGSEEAAGILPGLELELFPAAQTEEVPGPPEPSPSTAPWDLEALVDVPLEAADRIISEAPVGAEEPTEVAALEAAAVALPTAPPEAPEMPAFTAPAPGPPLAEAPGIAGDMTAMRQAVTERVAHELARDLSDKLLERIERIVWEVVPDLAEILITKEIERIRALAEEKQSS